MPTNPDPDHAKPVVSTDGLQGDQRAAPEDFGASIPATIQASYEASSSFDRRLSDLPTGESKSHPAPDWDIRLEGRSWSRQEMLARIDALPVKLEVLHGKLCLGIEQRLLLLGALLECTGLELAVRLGDAKCWQDALAARSAEERRTERSAHQASLSLEPNALASLEAESYAIAGSPEVARGTWNYRVMSFQKGEDEWQAIHEVHYLDGVPVGYSAAPADVLWDPAEGNIAAGLRCLERMKEALLKPVLTEADFAKGERIS